MRKRLPRRRRLSLLRRFWRWVMTQCWLWGHQESLKNYRRPHWSDGSRYGDGKGELGLRCHRCGREAG